MSKIRDLFRLLLALWLPLLINSGPLAVSMTGSCEDADWGNLRLRLSGITGLRCSSMVCFQRATPSNVSLKPSRLNFVVRPTSD